MKEYKIEIVLVSSAPPEWVVEAIEDQLEAGEAVKYFDYTIEDKTK